jgi:hypothetical protein
LSLLAPLFLAGILAIGLPLWLHRLSSENPNRQPFSSLMFLEAGEPRRILAKNLQYLLLLALRIAVLVLLALAFAQPTLWRSPQAAAGDGARLHVIALDASASMAYEDRWERAQDEALDIVEAMAPDDRGQVLLAGRTTQLLTSETLDRADVRPAVNPAAPGVFHLDYGLFTRALDGVVRAAELPVVMHIVTDAQQTGLPTRFADLAPRQSMELQVHDIGGEAADNWAVDVLTGSALSGELQAGVRSFAARSADKTLRLTHNGQVVDERVVTVDAGGRAQVTFAPLALAAGSNRVRVDLRPADGLVEDDARILALQRPEPRPVLLVSGDLRDRDTLFVESAMQSLTQLALSVNKVAPSAMGDRQLTDYNFVVIADAAALDAGQTAALRAYVEAGGAVLQALGPRSTGLTAVPLTGQTFAVTPGVRSQSYAAVGAMDASHPALRGVGSLRTAKFFRHAPIEPGPNDQVLISLDNGAPLLLESTVGVGRVLSFTSSLDREWNDLAVQPAFVPLIAGVANHLLGGAGFSSEAELGSTLALRALGMQGGQIFDPDGDPALGLGGGTDDVLLNQVGFYELVGGGRSELVAVNFDTRESDLTAMSGDTIARWQGLGRRVDAGNPAGPEAAAQAEVPIALGQWLLLLLLIAFAMESWVGNWHLRVRRGIAA